MQGFTPGLFDKLMPVNRSTSSSDIVLRLSMDDLKDAVARDLEALLNTRKVVSEELFESYPECRDSIATYGLNDFAGLSLASTDDRAYICRSLEQTIARHEPRLCKVSAMLEVQEGSINRLNFAISAMLVMHPANEPVSFDAVLQPSSLHYSINRTRKTARAGAEHG